MHVDARMLSCKEYHHLGNVVRDALYDGRDISLYDVVAVVGDDTDSSQVEVSTRETDLSHRGTHPHPLLRKRACDVVLFNSTAFVRELSMTQWDSIDILW